MARRDRKAARQGAQRLSRRMGPADPRNHRRENIRQVENDLADGLEVNKDGRVQLMLGKGLAMDRQGLQLSLGRGLCVSKDGRLEIDAQRGPARLQDNSGGSASTKEIANTGTSAVDNNFATQQKQIEDIVRALERAGVFIRR